MKVEVIPNGRFLENCYLIGDPGRGVCAVVDPGEDAAHIIARLDALALKPVAIWLTHAHVDHVAGVGPLVAHTRAPVFLHPADRPLYDRVVAQAAGFGLRVDAPPPPDRSFVRGEVLALGDLRIEVRHAPGHSPGSVCLLAEGEDVVFAGDVLFRESIGRTDLPGGDLDTLLGSIARELLSLPDATVVYSGHGPETTIGHERRHNPFLGARAR